jgi:hypothetical protein
VRGADDGAADRVFREDLFDAGVAAANFAVGHAFLASEVAAYVMGTVVPVDRGMSMQPRRTRRCGHLERRFSK